MDRLAAVVGFIVTGRHRDLPHERSGLVDEPAGPEEAPGEGEGGLVPAAWCWPISRQQGGSGEPGDRLRKVARSDLGRVSVPTPNNGFTGRMD